MPKSTPKMILLVEDDRMFRNLVRAALSGEGYEIHEASSGALAHEAIEANPYDLLIVDGSLTDTDGMSFVRELRQRGMGTPIIFVSTLWRDAHSHRKLSEDLQVKVILHKPLNPMLVAAHADNILRGTDAAS